MSAVGVRGLMMLAVPLLTVCEQVIELTLSKACAGRTLFIIYRILMKRVPDSIPEDERIWFALVAYNIGCAHMLGARALTAKQQGNPDSWIDVKLRLPMLSQPRYYKQTLYGYARGQQAYNYVENIRRYEISLVGYLQEKEKKAAQLTAYNAGPANVCQVVISEDLQMLTPYGTGASN